MSTKNPDLSISLPATTLIDTALRDLSKELADKFRFMSSRSGKFEKWFQFELAYYLEQLGASEVDYEISRRYDKRRCNWHDIGRTDIEFRVPNLKKNTHFAVEIKTGLRSMNFSDVIKDIEKTDLYCSSEWDLRGVFYIKIGAAGGQRTSTSRRFKTALLDNALAKNYPIPGTDLEIMLIHWEDKTTDPKKLWENYKRDFLDVIEELWNESR